MIWKFIMDISIYRFSITRTFKNRSLTYPLFLFDRWEVDDWGACSKTCGGGFRERKVSCVSDRGGKKIKVMLYKLWFDNYSQKNVVIILYNTFEKIRIRIGLSQVIHPCYHTIYTKNKVMQHFIYKRRKNLQKPCLM